MKIVQARDDFTGSDINFDAAQLLKWKGLNHISDKAYSSLCNVVLSQDVLKHLPKIWRLYKLQSEIASENPVYQNELGVYVNASVKIAKLLNAQYRYVEEKNQKINEKSKKLRFPVEKIKIKLSGDGTDVANNKLLNICVSFPDFKGCNTAHGNYTLGIFEIEKENYDSLKIALKEILVNLKTFKQVVVNGKSFEIDWYLGGDMKFVCIVLGLDGNFTHGKSPCPWCTCTRDNFLNYETLECSLTDKNKFARILEDALKKENHGHVRDPLVDWITF